MKKLEKGDIIAVARRGFVNFGVLSHFGTGRLYYWDSFKSFEKGKLRYIISYTEEPSICAFRIDLDMVPQSGLNIRNELSEILCLLNI